MQFTDLMNELYQSRREYPHFDKNNPNKLNFGTGFSLGHNTPDVTQAIYKILGNITKINNSEDTSVFQLDQDVNKGFVVIFSNQGYRPAGDPKEYFGSTITFVQNKEDLFKAIETQCNIGNFVSLKNSETESKEQLAQKDIDRVSFTNDDSKAFQMGKSVGEFVKRTMNSVKSNISSLREDSLNNKSNDKKSRNNL